MIETKNRGTSIKIIKPLLQEYSDEEVFRFFDRLWIDGFFLKTSIHLEIANNRQFYVFEIDEDNTLRFSNEQEEMLDYLGNQTEFDMQYTFKDVQLGRRIWMRQL